MRKLIPLYFLCVSVFSVKAQDSYYDHIAVGKYSVRYSDTVIYDPAIHYEQYGYSGPAPLFVQVWFPSMKATAKKRLAFGQYKFHTIPAGLSRVYEKLSSQMDEIFIRDGIESNMMNDEPIDYGHLTTRQVLEKINRLATISSRSAIDAKLDYPVIVYQHGSQGLSSENTVMAEYFASHGYVFITANFHLPYENTIYGLLPYHLEKENKHNQSSAKALINFAKSIAAREKVFFIGHSWGAQEGWCFLDDPAWADAFVSMETTIEFKKDTARIKELWPYVWDAIQVKRNTFSIPVLLFAAADDDTNFDFFKGLSSAPMIFASYKEPFAHNSYTSLSMMRCFLRKDINQPDSAMLLNQVKGYARHLDLIHAFFKALLKNEKLNLSPFDNYFKFE
jgi:dienelactone hydrolase